MVIVLNTKTSQMEGQQMKEFARLLTICMILISVGFGQSLPIFNPYIGKVYTGIEVVVSYGWESYSSEIDEDFARPYFVLWGTITFDPEQRLLTVTKGTLFFFEHPWQVGASAISLKEAVIWLNESWHTVYLKKAKGQGHEYEFVSTKDYRKFILREVHEDNE